MKQTMFLTILIIFIVNINLFADWIELHKILASDGFQKGCMLIFTIKIQELLQLFPLK